ncbi:MAG: hypothetical protein COT84_02290 [Chlamydiae bacterium CG10_big_fil_rev_8_21_14_0_10_35_9]|nr:MAG: hypothetical protein COT84_02290 [Chlamydiae bacterium CG10_big_fil_rev_8_21_14_0_10_35_9]
MTSAVATSPIIHFPNGLYSEDDHFNSHLLSRCTKVSLESLSFLKEKIKKLSFSFENRLLQFNLEGSANNRAFQINGKIPSSFIPKASEVNSSFALISSQLTLCDKLQEKAKISFAVAAVAYIVQFVFSTTIGCPLAVSWIARVLIMGFPISDAIRSVRFTQRLNVCDRNHSEALSNLEKIKISEASSSFIGGVLFAFSKFAQGFQNIDLANIFSLFSLPYYAFSYGIEIVDSGCSAYYSHKLGKKISSFENKNSQPRKEQLEEAFIYLKSLFCLSDKKIEGVVSEFLKDSPDPSVVNKKYQQFKNEQLAALNDLQKQIGTEAFSSLLKDINQAFNDLKEDKLEKAEALLQQLQKNCYQQVLAALKAILVSFATLLAFILFTLYSAGILVIA